MTSTTGYYCSSCEMALKTEKGWLHHLLSPEHQAKAREDLVSWNFQLRERGLVAFSKLSLAFENVLAVFKDRNDGRSHLSGFMWNEKRPRVGLLLFESREKRDRFLDGLRGGLVMRIGDYQLLQLRKATDYLELEWELFVQEFYSEFNTGVKTGLKREMDVDEKRDENETEVDDNRRVMKIEPVSSSLLTLNLVSQFDSICREIEIGDDGYNKALNIMEKCHRVLNANYEGCRLIMFRHGYLKLRGQGANELFFYFDAEGLLGDIKVGDIRRPTKLLGGVQGNFLAACTAQRILPGIRCRFDTKNFNVSLGFEKTSALNFVVPSKNAAFTLVTDIRYAVEAQTCRLLNYLLDFDPRARPFITLMFCWAEQNRAKLAYTSIIHRTYTWAFAPDPAGLEWMVIFFLCHKGILPTPREILKRGQHFQVLYKFRDSRKDIGFTMDAKFAEEWTAPDVATCHPVGSNEFVLGLVKLSKEFFTFYGELQKSPQKWILNTKDGELMKMEDLQSTNPNEFETRLTNQELAEVRNPQASDTHIRLNGLNNRRFAILHPLILQWTIPCELGKISLNMLASAKIIENWLRTLDDGDEAEDRRNMATLQNLFGDFTSANVRVVM